MKAIFSLKHVSRLTDQTGIIEHCTFTTPNRKEGYCIDDNARALLACLKVGKREKKTAQQLIHIYLGFLVRACDKKGFHQDLDPDLTWKDDAGVEDGFGRAMVSLGEAILSAPQDNQRSTATHVFDRQAYLIPTIKYLRVMAQAIIAISKRIKFKGKRKTNYFGKKPLDLKKELIVLSDKLVKNYQKKSSRSWKWFEDIIAYDNGRLPYSLFIAFQVTKNKKYLKIAKESLDFLIKQTYDSSKNCFSFTGNKGWHRKNKKPAVFDQQPIEAGSMVEVCAKAYEVLKDPKYLHFAETAFLWYSGKNIVGLSMIDNITGGVYDGLEPQKVNENEGAESILSYILACQALKEIKK